MAVQSRFFALIQIGAIDAFFVYGTEVEGLASEFFLQPVYDILYYARQVNPELYQLLYDRQKVVTFTQEPTTGITDAVEMTHTMAISLLDAPLLTRLNFDTSELYLAMLATARRPYELAKALEVIFDLSENCSAISLMPVGEKAALPLSY